MKRSESRLPRGMSDLIALAFFLLLSLFFFAPVLFGHATLIPFDNLFRFPPWDSFAAAQGVTAAHNPLLDDLVLENYPWKNFILESLRAGELPLWNPYILAGQPFLAAGQNAALYPFGIIFLIMPLTQAYGVFTALHFWLAATSMYFLARVFRLSPFASAVSGIIYAFSGFMVVSIVFPMIVSAAAWLPAILAMVELSLREENKRRLADATYSPAREILFALLASILLGMQFLAGHVEVSYYILMVLGYFALWRTIAMSVNWSSRRVDWRQLVRSLLVLGGVLLLGFSLAAIQLVPLAELVQYNFRAGSVSYDQVAGWALPARQAITFLIPDFFGNPIDHSYFDIFDRITKPAPTGTIFWGVKNYVEAGAFVGVFALVLALIAVCARIIFSAPRLISRRAGNPSIETIPDSVTAQDGVDPFAQIPISLFAVLALLSLLFAFGTPFYALLFYGLPGYNQLHTAFRWIFPFTLCVAFLAGAGIQVIKVTGSNHPDYPAVTTSLLIFNRLVRILAAVTLGGGLLVLLVLFTSFIIPAPFINIADRIVASSDLARPVFETGRAFYSYQLPNFLLFGCSILFSGLILWLSRKKVCLPRSLGSFPLWQPLAVALVIAELFIIGRNFYPASDSRLAQFTPPALEFLQRDHSLFRFATYDLPGQKVLNANAAMPYDISDIRGYDSIISRQYVEYMSQLAPQDELLYNRIASFYDYKPLSSRLLDLLNVKYVLTLRSLPNPGYKLVYDGELKIYENLNNLPRAFFVPNAVISPDRTALARTLASSDFDPTWEVLLEQPGPLTSSNGGWMTEPGLPQIEKYSGSEVILKTNAPQAAYLVLADSYFPGWVAQIDGTDTPIYRADGNFRAVYVPAGEHAVRFKYSPLSLKVGSVVSLVAFLVVMMSLIALMWRRIVMVETGSGSQVRVVARNSLVPMGASVINQVLSFAFALVMLRVLGPTNVGRYAFATAVWFFLNSITDFGLGILMTREVARDHGLANRYLTNTSVLRLLLTLVSFLPLVLLLVVYNRYGELGAETIITILLLWISLIPGNLAASLSYLFNAYERFEFPTAVAMATSLLSVSLQIAALLAGFGIIGLATVSIISNIFSLIALGYLVRRMLFKPRWEFNAGLLRWMFFESYPLMFNNLLANLFFRIDVFLLQPLKGDLILGYYSTAYKFINALNFIPSSFTLAIFPQLSRYSTNSKDAMRRALIVAIKLLVWLAIPLTIGIFFLSNELIFIFGGVQYLPDSAIALRWLVWFLPFSYINSVLHYVLIALNQQRFLTKAFLVGLIFNVIANLIAIPLLSYRGAALVTVLSEFALLIPFYYSLRQHLGGFPLVDVFWRPVAAGVAMAFAFFFLLPQFGIVLGSVFASLVYIGLLLLLGAIGPDEWVLIARLLPHRFERALGVLSRGALR